jgi:hypothetical protein
MARVMNISAMSNDEKTRSPETSLLNKVMIKRNRMIIARETKLNLSRILFAAT